MKRPASTTLFRIYKVTGLYDAHSMKVPGCCGFFFLALAYNLSVVTFFSVVTLISNPMDSSLEMKM